MKLNNKGFSFVELLAAVAILAILSSIAIVGVTNILNKAHDEYYNNEEKNLVLAAQAYYNTNKSELPKVVGIKKKVTAKRLRETNYLKEDLTTYDGKTPCNPVDSYVKVFKYGKNDYSYTAYLTCGNRKAAEQEKLEKPAIEVLFPGKKEDVATSKVVITFKGEAGSDTKLLSYSYILYKIEDGKSIQLYNSGNMETRQSEIVKTISLSRYTISGNAMLKVKATATNIKGNTISRVFINNYSDKKLPTCTYKNKENDPNSPFRRTGWINHDDVVTIYCHDGDGSGCEKNSYTKTFTNDGPSGKIKISDNALNTFDCPIVTHIDKTPPKIDVVAYKCKKDGNSYVPDTTQKVGSITVEGSSDTLSSSSFTGNVNGWLNRANYPNGVCFDFTITDAAAIKSTKWSWNKTDYKKNASGYNVLDGSGSPISKNYDTTGMETTKKITEEHSLTAEGHRYARYEVTDGIGNKTTLNFNILIDRTPPTMTITAGRCNDRVQANCLTSSMTASQTKTLNKDKLSDTMNFDGWISKGLRINFNISDKNDTTRDWKYNKTKNMASRPAATTASSTNPSATSNGVLTLTGNGYRQGIITATDEAGNAVQMTINVDIANTCKVTYSKNGGTFNNNSNDIEEVKDYDSYFGSQDNGLRNARGSGGFYYATHSSKVVAKGTEWNLQANGRGTALDQDNRYKSQHICSNMESGDDQTATLYVRWLTNDKALSIYAWKYQSKDCDYDEDGDTLKKTHPYRRYHFHSYKCYCKYSSNNSSLQAKAYFKRHSSRSECSNIINYNDASWSQRCDDEEEKIKTANGEHNCANTSPINHCFREFANIFYEANDKGKAACNASNYQVNEYVYQVCSTPHPGGTFFFHGVYFYKTTGSQTPHFNRWLTNNSAFMNNGYHRRIIPSSSFVTSKFAANKFSYNNSTDNDVQTTCTDYCTKVWGSYRTEKQDAYVDEDEADLDDSD